MANEMSLSGPRGQTAYFRLWRQSDGETYIAGGIHAPGWESETVAHWDAIPSYYAISAVEADHGNGGTGLYQASMPGSLPAGVYNYTLYFQVGANSSILTDAPQGTGFIDWSGSADTGAGNAILQQAFPANFAALGITSGGKVSEVVLVDTLTTYTGNIPQSGDVYAKINAGSVTYTTPAIGVGGAVTINRGSAYLVVLGTAIGPIPVPLAVQDLSPFTPSQIQMRWPGTTLIAASINTPGTSTQSVTFEADSLATAAMQAPYGGVYYLWVVPSNAAQSRLDVTGNVVVVPTV